MSTNYDTEKAIETVAIQIDTEMKELRRRVKELEETCTRIRRIQEPLAANSRIMQVANAARQTLNVLKEVRL